jgi:hypothetical protein
VPNDDRPWQRGHSDARSDNPQVRWHAALPLPRNHVTALLNASSGMRGARALERGAVVSARCWPDFAGRDLLTSQVLEINSHPGGNMAIDQNNRSSSGTLGGKAALLFGLAALVMAGSGSTAAARELGVGNQYPGGLTIGIPTAAHLPPGLYMLDRANYYAGDINFAGNKVGDISVVAGGAQFLWFMPAEWTSWLGATNMAFVSIVPVQVTTNIAGVVTRTKGFADIPFSPINLSWNLGGGWFFGAGVTLYSPSGTIEGPLGTSGIGAPFWTFEPNVSVAYLSKDWNIALHLLYNTNTRNPNSNFTSGDQFFVDFAATRKFGNWRLGPVAYFTTQTTSDVNAGTSYGPAGCGIPGICSSPTSFALGGLIGYDWGKVSLDAYATNEVHTSGDSTKGYRVWVNLGYKLGWDEPARGPLIRK